MHQVATRKYDITQKLEFTVDSEGLPVLEAIRREAMRPTGYYAEQIDAVKIIPMIFGSEQCMRSYEFKQKALRCIPEVTCETAYLELRKQAFQMGLMRKRILGEKDVYYERCSASNETTQNELF
jgi:hypothetical protein